MASYPRSLSTSSREGLRVPLHAANLQEDTGGRSGDGVHPEGGQVRILFLFSGWHRNLNTRSGHPNLGLYKLVTLLREEADTVDIQIRLVSENLLCKIRRKKYKQLHGRLEDAITHTRIYTVRIGAICIYCYVLPLHVLCVCVCVCNVIRK